MQPLPFCDWLILLKIHHNLLFVLRALKRMGERALVTGNLSPVQQLAISQSFIRVWTYMCPSLFGLCQGPMTISFVVCLLLPGNYAKCLFVLIDLLNYQGNKC